MGQLGKARNNNITTSIVCSLVNFVNFVVCVRSTIRNEYSRCVRSLFASEQRFQRTITTTNQSLLESHLNKSTAFERKFLFSLLLLFLLFNSIIIIIIKFNFRFQTFRMATSKIIYDNKAKSKANFK